MRKWILAAALMAAPMTVQAQVEYKFTNFASTANGFTTTLLFRNIGQYGDAKNFYIYAFRVGVSSSAVPYCGLPGSDCNIGGGTPYLPYTVGNVQRTVISTPPGQYTPFSSFVEDSCGGNVCLSRGYIADGFGVLGCQASAAIFRDYWGRTCAADGYDGWVAQNLNFYANTAASTPINLTQADVGASFFVREMTGPNAILAPEPSTYALMAAGLLALGAFARRRRTTV